MEILSDLSHYHTFFQERSSYYIDKVNKYKEGKKFTFNIAAFFFGFIWFTYRKMYLEAFLLFLFIVVEGIIEASILSTLSQEESSAVGLVMTVLMGAALGFLGNYLYIRKAERTIRKALQKENDPQKIDEYLHRKGGTSYLFIIAILVMVIAFVIMNNYALEEG